MPAQARRLDNLPAYVFAIIGDRLRQMQLAGVDVIRLDVGSPDMPPPDHVVKQLCDYAHKADQHGYSGYRGIPAFREAVARYYKTRFNVEVNADTEILPLIGSKEGIVNLNLAYLDPGDVVLIPDVGYPSYAQAARLVGAEIHWLPITQDTNYLPDFDAVPAEIRQKAKMLWLNYPNNPTGAVADIDFYAKAVAFCAENDILLASDNPYVEVTYESYVAPSVLEVTNAQQHALEFMSCSKTYNMAGWRLGAAVGSADAVKWLLRVKSNMDSGHFRPVYQAGIDALDNTSNEWLRERNRIYEARRDRILEMLPKIGLQAEKPLGSLYIWAKPDNMTPADYIEGALTEAHVSLAPGSAYGPGGEDFIRISLAVEDTRLDEALGRLEARLADYA